MKKKINKELVMTKEDNENSLNENSTKCWICDNDYVDNDDEVRDYCHISGKYKGFAHRDCNINLNLNHKISVVFHNLKKYDYNLIFQEIGNFSLKMSVIPNGLEKYMSFIINNKLSFTDSFHFLSSSLDSLVKNYDFKYLSQEFDNNVLDLVKLKRLYPYEFMSNFENFNPYMHKMGPQRPKH